MIWLAWRQLRIPAVSVYGALAGIGVVLLVTGIEMTGRTDHSDQEFLYGATLVAVYALPAILGVFWGVPIITRELDAGTHTIVWTQSITRERWLAAKLGVGVTVAMVAAGALSLAVTWWAGPLDAMGDQGADVDVEARLSPVAFAARGIAPVGYAAFAFVLGVALGIVLRRTVTAMAVTLVVFAAVMVAVPFAVRPYLLPAAEETTEITSDGIVGVHAEVGDDGLVVVESLVVAPPAGAWVLANETVDAAGDVANPLPGVARNCMMPPLVGPGPPPDVTAVNACFARLSDDGYQQRLVYHPASRFWPLQWLELAFFLALSALLTWFCLRRIRHLH